MAAAKPVTRLILNGQDDQSIVARRQDLINQCCVLVERVFRLWSQQAQTSRHGGEVEWHDHLRRIALAVRLSLNLRMHTDDSWVARVMLSSLTLASGTAWYWPSESGHSKPMSLDCFFFPLRLRLPLVLLPRVIRCG